MATLNSFFGFRIAVFRLLFSLFLALILTACAHTEKYLHPERTFSLDTYDTSEAGRGLRATGHELPIYETCADKASGNLEKPLILTKSES